jgi:hypothetical protein
MTVVTAHLSSILLFSWEVAQWLTILEERKASKTHNSRPIGLEVDPNNAFLLSGSNNTEIMENGAGKIAFGLVLNRRECG